MPTIRIDDNAHSILQEAKKRLQKELESKGIKANPTTSDAVRYLARLANFSGRLQSGFLPFFLNSEFYKHFCKIRVM